MWSLALLTKLKDIYDINKIIFSHKYPISFVILLTSCVFYDITHLTVSQIWLSLKEKARAKKYKDTSKLNKEIILHSSVKRFLFIN